MPANATPGEIQSAFQTIDSTVLGPAITPVGPEQLKVVFKRWAVNIARRIPFSMHFPTGGRRQQWTTGKTNFTSRDREFITHSIGLGLIDNLADIEAMFEKGELWVDAVYEVYTLHNQLQTTVPGTGIVAKIDFEEAGPYTFVQRPIQGQPYLMLDVPMVVVTNRKRSYG